MMIKSLVLVSLIKLRSLKTGSWFQVEEVDICLVISSPFVNYRRYTSRWCCITGWYETETSQTCRAFASES